MQVSKKLNDYLSLPETNSKRLNIDRASSTSAQSGEFLHKDGYQVSHIPYLQQEMNLLLCNQKDDQTKNFAQQTHATKRQDQADEHYANNRNEILSYKSTVLRVAQNNFQEIQANVSIELLPIKSLYESFSILNLNCFFIIEKFCNQFKCEYTK